MDVIATQMAKSIARWGKLGLKLYEKPQSGHA
jgi:hypothetical protein